MSVILLEREEHARAALAKILGQLGYQQILSGCSLRKAEYFLKRYSSRVQLMIVGETGRGETFNEFPGIVDHNDKVFFAPLIQIDDSWKSIFTRAKSTRVDGRISRPFGAKSLLATIERSRIHRAQHRDTILLLNQDNLTQSEFKSTDSHWKKIIQVDRLEDFAEVLRLESPRIGTVIVNPERAPTAAIARLLTQFRRSQVGAATSVAVLSRQPQLVRDFRTVADLFAEHPNDSSAWMELCGRLSRRTVYGFGVREMIVGGRKAVRAGKLRDSLKMVKAGLQVDPSRAEIHELAGTVAERQGRTEKAIQHFKAALQDNPCSPFSYLRLMDLLASQSERESVAELGQQFCPAHPQVLARVRALGDSRLS